MAKSSYPSIYDKNSAASSETLVPKAPAKAKDYEAAAAALMSQYGFGGNVPAVHAMSKTKHRERALENAVVEKTGRSKHATLQALALKK